MFAVLVAAGCSPAPRGAGWGGAQAGAGPVATVDAGSPDGTSDTAAAKDVTAAAPDAAAGPGRAGCLPHAEAWQQQQAIEQQNRGAFEAAVGQAGLRLVALAIEYEELYDGQFVPPPGGQHEPRAPWTEYTGAAGQQRLAGPAYRSNCARAPGPAVPDFAQSDDGTIYRLSPQARNAGDVVLPSCGCPVVDMSGMCGAYMPRHVQMTFALPAGSRYGGEKDVAYPRRNVQIGYAKKLGTPECPMPNPPP